MRKVKVYQNYSNWDADSLYTLTGRTLSSMVDNEYFPDPRPTMEEYALLVNDYCRKQAVARDGGSRYEREARNNAKKLILRAMRELAFYVNVMADGNVEILASSGFMIVPPPKPIESPGVPQNVRLSDGRVSGELRLMFNSIPTATEYEYIYASTHYKSNDLEWGEIHRTTNSRVNFISGLTPGERLYVRVRARNGKGIGDWSREVSIIIR